MPIMEKAIKLLSLVDKNNFIDIYFVISKPARDVFAIESIAFLTYEEAKSICDYKNKSENTTRYRVFSTCAHV